MWSSLTSSVSSMAGYGTGAAAAPKPGDIPGAGEGVKSHASLCKNGEYYHALTKKDLEWTIAPHASTETQTFYVITEQGHFGYVQMIHSNLGIWGTPINVQFSARFVGNGLNKFFTVNLTNFALTPDRLSASTNLMSITLSPDGNKYTIQITNPPELIVSLTVERVADGYKIGEDGKSLFGDGFVSHKFWPACKVGGMMIVEGKANDMAGQGTFVHAIQGMRPNLVAAHWNYVDFDGKQAENGALTRLNLIQFITPYFYESAKVSQGSVVVDGKLVAVSVENQVEYVQTKLDEETGYNPPTEIKYVWEGKTLESKETFKATLTVKPHDLSARVDLLAELPWALKKIVSTFVAKPIIYQLCDEAEGSVTIGDKEHKVSGKVYHEITFVQ